MNGTYALEIVLSPSETSETLRIPISAKSSKKPTDTSIRPPVKGILRERKSTASISHLTTPACTDLNKCPNEVPTATEVPLEVASVMKVALELNDYIPELALSSRTTDSGDSPTETSILKQPVAPSVMFDDEVFFALAAADEEERMRDEEEFRAIIRSFG